MKSLYFLILSCVLTLPIAGCGSNDGTNGVPKATLSSAPMLGKADATDGADRDCRVVLRQVARDWAPEQETYETWCDDDACTFVWRGTVDVAEQATGDVVVLYRLSPRTTWYEIPTLQIPARTPGFTTHAFVIAEHVFGPGVAPGDEPAVELVAFLRDGDGGRLFDHNVHAGDLDNTILEAANGFMDSQGYGVCQPTVGLLSFDAAWNVTPAGARRQGGFLRVDYAMGRLPDCRSTHNGYPAWDIIAHVRFLPGGQESSASLRQPSEFFSATDSDASFMFRIPTDAQRVELWFENTSGAGSSCQTWDSNFGANYGFEIWPAADHPRCLDLEKDTFSSSDPRYVNHEAFCVGYDHAAAVDATHCEFHVDALGLAYEGHYGIPLRWMFAWINVNAVDGVVENAGLFTRFQDEVTGESGRRFSMGREFSPGRWRVGFTYEKMVYAGNMVPAIRAQIQEFAFFLDVRRPDGTVVRLWQSRQGQNFPFSDVQDHLGATEYIPYGNIRMVNDDALVFDARDACAQ